MITLSPCSQFAGVATLCCGRQLERVDHPQHLVEVAAGRHRVDEDQLDLLVRPDHEHVPHRLVVGRRALRRLAGGVGREHPVELRDVEVRVADQRVVGRVSLRLLDVARPLGVVVERVDGEPDDLHVPAVELGLDAGHVAELGGAYGREVARMREQDRPRVADPVVEADPALGGVRLEVGRGVADLQSHVVSFVVRCLCSHSLQPHGAGKQAREEPADSIGAVFFPKSH